VLARNPTYKKSEPPAAEDRRVEEIRKASSERWEKARRDYRAGKGTFGLLRSKRYEREKYRHLADAVIRGNPQQAFGKSWLDWLERLKLLAAHKILTDLNITDLGHLSNRDAARIIIAGRPAIAKLANENQIVNLRKKFGNKSFRTKNEFVLDAWQCIWEEAPRDCHPIDFACFLIASIKLPR
jgi:hypothetical protein